MWPKACWVLVRLNWGDLLRQVWVSGPAVLDEHRSSTLEWLSTNGLGGFASGTVSGINTRRYHAVLLAAPLVEARFVLVSQVQEVVSNGHQHWLLGATHYPDTIHPQGYRHILRFTTFPFPTWIYSSDAWVLEKRLAMVRGANATVIQYRLIEGPDGLSITLQPLLAGRNYHYTRREQPAAFHIEQTGEWWRATAHGVPDTYLAASGAFTPKSVWHRNVRYPIEAARGLDYEEDLYQPGEFVATLTPGDTAWLVAWSGGATDSPPVPMDLAKPVFTDTVVRQSSLLDQAGNPHGITANLVVAADSYIIERSGHASVIAGYPWFTDWGRDAMISLPGLFLTTGRASEALSVLTTFAAAEKDGLIPNRFPDQSTVPEYNTVDASLWFINACLVYYRYTQDQVGLSNLWPTIKNIIAGYRSGTHYSIGVDERGLVHAGEEGVQLTWMDAKVGNWVVTPRQGFPVEINALWYNALRAAAHLALDLEPAYGEQCRIWARGVKKHFLSAFWSPEHGYLADVVHADGSRDMSMRPNQLFAISLPYALVKGDEARSVVQQVWSELYTPLGLRTLAPDDPNYKGRYEGDQWSRDGAYHRGTAWAWLMGPFITAYRKAYGRTPHTRSVARRLVTPLLDHLWDAGLGHVSEVFDADPPHTPGGCFAQAWSVAELLRLWAEEFDQEPLEEASKGRQVFHGY